MLREKRSYQIGDLKFKLSDMTDLESYDVLDLNNKIIALCTISNKLFRLYIRSGNKYNLAFSRATQGIYGFNDVERGKFIGISARVIKSIDSK